MATKKKTDESENTADAVVETEAVESTELRADAGAKAKESRAKAPAKKAATAEDAEADPTGVTVKRGKRAEKIGVVASDKMTKTVVVRVDRLVKHPIYRKYVRKRKKFMAHDEMGSKVGDKVRIVETRPMSARKRWRVVEIIHKAEL